MTFTAFSLLRLLVWMGERNRSVFPERCRCGLRGNRPSDSSCLGEGSRLGVQHLDLWFLIKGGAGSLNHPAI